MHVREQACWLTLVFESQLPVRIVNNILVDWCKRAGRTLEDFFATSHNEWSTVCHLKDEVVQKLLTAQEKLASQAFLVEQLQHNGISLITVLDERYPSLLKSTLTRSHIPPILFYAGDLAILGRQTTAIIGSRNAGEESLSFTRAIAQYLAEHGQNVISGHARGVDRTAYEGAIGPGCHTTVVLAHGIRKLSKAQFHALQPRIESGNVLLLSQFHPNAPWLISRAMERNNVVTALAQVVIVAESDTHGGTWEGANGALKQGRSVYIRTTEATGLPPGNKSLIEKGGKPLLWPTNNSEETFAPLLTTDRSLPEKQDKMAPTPNQLSLLSVSYEP